MSLSLLASYGSSSESESDNEEITFPKKEENISNVINNKNKKDSEFTTIVSNNNKLSSILPPPKKTDKSIFSAIDNNSKKHSLFSQLPQPKKNKENKVASDRKRKYISLIAAPIEDDDDDETAELKREIEEERRRKLSKNGNTNNFYVEKNMNKEEKQGLFSLLPSPKNSNKTDEKKENKANTTFGMIPLSLKRKEEKKKMKEKEKMDNKNEVKDEVKEEDEGIVNDFFSLDTPEKTLEIDSKELNENLETNIQENDEKPEIKANPEIDNSNESSNNYIHYNNQQNYDNNQYQYPQNVEAYNYDYYNNYNQYYYPEAGASNSDFNNNILKLQEMGEFNIGEIKEVNQKDQISDVYEVERTKQISMSNQPSLNFRGISQGFKPSFKQKSKHNIMYLAFQAKAKETELLEANLQRKANRKISGRKYGF